MDGSGALPEEVPKVVPPVCPRITFSFVWFISRPVSLLYGVGFKRVKPRVTRAL